MQKALPLYLKKLTKGYYGSAKIRCGDLFARRPRQTLSPELKIRITDGKSVSNVL